MLWLFSTEHPRIRKVLGVLTAVAVVALTVLWIRVPGEVSTEVIRQLSGRNILWGKALHLIREHPILGIGPNNWGAWLPRNVASVEFLRYDRVGNWSYLPNALRGEAHNLFLTQAAELGLPSLLGLVGLFVTWWRLATQATCRLTDAWSVALAHGCMASMAGLAVLGLFENGPIIGEARGEDLVVVWLVAALPLVLGRIAVFASDRRPAQSPASACT